jgi:hypothetical protein
VRLQAAHAQAAVAEVDLFVGGGHAADVPAGRHREKPSRARLAGMSNQADRGPQR